MREIEQTRRANNRNLSVSRGDLKYLWGMAADVGGSRTTLEIGNFVIDNKDELENVSLRRLKKIDLTIFFDSGHTALVIEPATAEVWAHNPVDPKALAAWTKLTEFARARQSNWKRIVFWGTAIVTNGAVLAIASLHVETIPLEVAIPLLCVVLPVVLWTAIDRRYIRIVDDHAVGFWEANRDKVVLEIIKGASSAVVGGIIGFLLGRMIK